MNIKYYDNINFYNKTQYDYLIKRLDRIMFNEKPKWGHTLTIEMINNLILILDAGIKSKIIVNVYEINTNKHNEFEEEYDLQKCFVATKSVKSINEVLFDYNKQHLKKLLNIAYDTKTNKNWNSHSSFGLIGRYEWGKFIMVHCHYYFLQFNN